MPGFVSPFATAVTANRLRPFPSAPPRTGLQAFQAYGSPVTHASTSVSDDGKFRVGVLHYAYLDAAAIESPASLRHVTGFPDRRLLRRLRRHGARTR